MGVRILREYKTPKPSALHVGATGVAGRDITVGTLLLHKSIATGFADRSYRWLSYNKKGPDTLFNTM